MNRLIFTKNTNSHISNSMEVIFWMSRDQRLDNNSALLEAQKYAIERKLALTIIFCLQKKFLNANERIFQFMQDGLHEIARQAKDMNISFVLLEELPQIGIPKYLAVHQAAALFTDFSPLKIKLSWEKLLLQNTTLPFFVIDSHNIVPVLKASNKQEFAARTLRPKLHKLLKDFLKPLHELVRHPFGKAVTTNIEVFSKKTSSPHADAQASMRDFVKNIERFELRNDPTQKATSQLSKYLHLGHISALQIALEVQKLPQSIGRDQFLEEIIVRKELSDNYCYFNEEYDNVKGFPQWAKVTLEKHSHDPREYNYNNKQFENAESHDELWNAAQQEMVKTGYMHGYLRMYWAKKILEWTDSAAEAQQIAILLNDKYQFDGRDPNGYTGIAWSIGGVHDRPWFERPIFGTIRYMNYSGATRKFDVPRYIEGIKRL